jgi:hypothetical protein
MPKISKNWCLLLLILMGLTLLHVNISITTAQESVFWWNGNWLSYTPVNVTETYGRSRTSELTDVFINFPIGTCSDPQREIRVLFYNGVNWTEVPSQVYNVTMRNSNAESCNVVFLADCPANSTVTYYIYYNNALVTKPEYDGLRVHEEAAGDTYNVTVSINGTEKNYTRIFWQSLMNLYSNGTMITWPGGPPGWEFSQINLGSLWADALGRPWFGANNSTGKFLSLVDYGALFVDFNYTQSFASDLWGKIFDYNTTTNLFLRVYYQPDLNPLVYFKKTFKIVTDLTNYTIVSPLYMDFKLANSTSQAIYRNFAYKALDGSIKTVETELPITANIWSPDEPIGWWSYNDTRSDSADKPAANMGLIPISANGTVPGDYTLKVVQQIEDDDHHCSQWMNGNYTGEYGDTIDIAGYITTNAPVDENVGSIMDGKAQTLRNPEPLSYSVGASTTLQLIDRNAPTIMEIVPALSGQEIPEGNHVEVKATVTDEPGIIAEVVVQPSGVKNASIQYSIDGGMTWTSINMTESAENNYNATLPLFASGTKIYYKITVVDNLLNKAESNVYSYKVVSVPQTGLWFIIGFIAGFVISIFILAAALYARKKS